MSKIVQAVNSMIENSQLITDVTKGINDDNEVFFIYKEKYKWSISKREDGCHLFYYPGNYSIKSLASASGHDFENIELVHYHDETIGTREAIASFLELHNIVTEKKYNMDVVFDDIISDTSF